MPLMREFGPPDPRSWMTEPTLNKLKMSKCCFIQEKVLAPGHNVFVMVRILM